MIKLITSAHSINNGRIYNLLKSINDLKTEEKKISYTIGKKADKLDLDKVVQITNSKYTNYLKRLFYALFFPLKFIKKGDLVIITTPDLIFTAFLMRIFVKYKLIVDVSENYMTLIEDRKFNKSKPIILKLLVFLNFLIKKADLITVSDDSFPPIGLMPRLTLKNIQFNMSSKVDLQYRKEDKPTAIYVGDLRKSRGLYDIVELAKKRQEWRFIVLGDISQEDRHIVMDAFENVKNLNFYTSTTYNNIIPYLCRAWVGLIPLHSTVAFNNTIPAKLYDYIAAELPVAAYHLNKSSHIINQYSIGVVKSNLNEISQFLEKIASDRKSLQSYEDNIKKLKSRLGTHRVNFKLFEDKLLEMQEELQRNK